MNNTYNTETREIDGRKYRIEWDYDDTSGRPEAESDGHGITLELNFDPADFGEDHDPEDGELDMEEVVRHKMMRVLHHGSTWRNDPWRVYDVWETMKVAKWDGWGVANPAGLTPDEIIAKAIDNDFNYLKGWYNDDWHWCGITVMLLDEEGDPTGDEASLWGLCSDDAERHEEVIADLVSEIQRQVKREAEKGQIPLPGTEVDHG